MREVASRVPRLHRRARPLTAIGICAAVTMWAPSAMIAQVVPAGQSFACTPTRVWDGDGPIWCSEGPRIRLAGIAAREIDGTCRTNQPCPRATATDARDHLVSLVGRAIGRSAEGHILVRGARLTCLSDGDGSGSRTAAWCRTAAGMD